MTGKVTDASGGVLANATVTATSIDNGETRSATTGTDGSYKIEGLTPGDYRLKFEAAGFKTMELASATVSGSGASVQDEKLDAGEQNSGKPSGAREFAECSVRYNDGAFACGSRPFSGADPGKRTGTSAAG